MAAPTSSQLVQLKKASVFNAIGQVVGDVVVGLIQNKTQRDFNSAKIAQLKEDSRLQALSAEERLAFDQKVANAVNDTARLRIYEEQLGNLGVATIQSTASVYAAKLQGKTYDSQKIGNYVLIGGGLLVVGTMIYLFKKKN
jgi:hypothetical protein